MTGGEPITARFMRQNSFEVRPEFKLWFATNDLPGVRGTADAFWRCVRLLPFTVQVTSAERDDDLPAKFKDEMAGILAWAVEGCRARQDEGLVPPEAVQRGPEGWQRKANHLKLFVNEDLVMDARNHAHASDVHGRYEAWCERHGEKPLDARRLNSALQGRA